jgi:hypothetical protein
MLRLERTAVVQLIDVFLDPAGLAFQEALDRVRKRRLLEPVRPTRSADQVRKRVGRKPRAILCSPWAPPSNTWMPCSMQNSSGW